MEMSEAIVQTLPPELAKAIVEAQKAVEAVKKGGFNQQLNKSYATADDIAAVGSEALNEHGAALVRLGSDLQPGQLADYELGNQAYAGDVVDQWWLVHESGSALSFTTRGAVIVSKGRPHDKAQAATQTYVSGVVGRGVLAMEREEKKHAVDAREDAPGDGPMVRRGTPVRSERKRDDVGPRCRGSKWPGDLGREIDQLVLDLAAGEGMEPDHVFGRLLELANVRFDGYQKTDGRLPQRASDLSTADGKNVKMSAQKWLRELANG